mmetsp:Transcript_46774/g.83820  ORF Transcript_46774/g.83820 Transcript_46774/m.83820 type:complete len:227 (+) Transcript_46774:1371-2051(+)
MQVKSVSVKNTQGWTEQTAPGKNVKMKPLHTGKMKTLWPRVHQCTHTRAHTQTHGPAGLCVAQLHTPIHARPHTHIYVPGTPHHGIHRHTQARTHTQPHSRIWRRRFTMAHTHTETEGPQVMVAPITLRRRLGQKEKSRPMGSGHRPACLVVQHAKQGPATMNPVGWFMAEAGEINVDHVVSAQASGGQSPLSQRGLVQGGVVYFFIYLDFILVDALKVDYGHLRV